MSLVGRLHELIDTLWREVEAGESPIGRGTSRLQLPPNAAEIANRAANIRRGWSAEEQVKRANGVVSQPSVGRRRPA